MNINWEFIISSLPLYEKAAWLTLKLAFAGIAASLFIGLLCSIVLYYKTKGLEPLVRAYIEVSRNTPLLIQLFFLYYGVTKLGFMLSEQTCAIVGLSFLGGSYMAEAFRAGIQSVSKSQIESGLSIGLSNMQLIRYVILPQAFSVTLPSLGANCIFLLKETSIVGVIAIPELMHLTQDLIGMYYQTFESLLMLIVAYLILLLPLSVFLSWLERRVRYAEFGN
ncbi:MULTISPECIES: amino acid ABC transporter permease [Sporomusa]|jgi:polar amino acid transport system permease protein|uniref:Inner membrane amino-acid ABC transporter permease protein YecS n=2 Tax=Sporomusa TaxID=2375 RepID=A0ABM9VYP7_9FIRM|nr:MULTISPECIES: amino acid ABC transporter permease [Sporomusa]MCM0760954.1 amino acid ABC transporter permease [Sporomusa sphaeroides DSM 2875]OLS57419.1 inner membrane amino-acid ABC transporter permease protein YecS [Sporomusa sphaeroides DSM 2875]CVK18017.1 Inner membrane amino-acid ABC transporter permease protein YecS [Sporomusa sphaeroides DSM 2875]SCM81248.1 Polar amino acid ABC transporter, inner membrane subunit [uncultured Sporomusa sp.]HML33736.1 amino acid ABC transporter permeas